MAAAQSTSIREFRDADVPVIARLIHRSIDTCYSGVYPPRAVLFFKDYHSPGGIRKRAKEGVILVMEHDGAAIGTGALVENEINGVFVEPALQGQGHGKAIMHALEKRACANGHGEVSLSVSLPSREFYEGLGYKVHGEAHIDVGEGQRLDFWKARKPLPGSDGGLSMGGIAFRYDRDLPIKDLVELYVAVAWSSAEKPEELHEALRNSHTVITAWDGARLAGLGNAISDGHMVVYYPHLLVHPDYQGRGIGSEIVGQMRKRYAGLHQQILVADGKAIDFYKKCGFEQAGKCQALWIYAGDDHD